jgi:3',5'-cyclic AMP phosphodiesterase CpdA
MGLLMQLSDLHFGAHDDGACEAVLRLARRLDVDLLVVSGDLTQRATPPQFALARDFVDRLPARHKLVLPGNHDIALFAWWLRLTGQAHRRYLRTFDAPLEPVVHQPGWCVVAVDTTRWWRHRHGSLSRAQIDAVAGRLAQAAPGDWRIVVSHHPLVDSGMPGQGPVPHLAPQALAHWAAAGARLVLSGHGHDPAVVQPLPGLWSVHAGTAVSVRLRAGAPNSLFTFEQAPGLQRQLTRWDFCAVRQEFEPTLHQSLD